MALTAYEEEYKDTYVGWIGEIPKDWEVSKVKFYFIRKNNKSNEENPIVLSLARSGVKIRDIDSGEGQLAESYCGYNPVKPGDLLLNPMDLISGANCSLSEVEGVISPAYVNLGPLENTYPKYYDYYFKTQYWSKALFVHGKGVSTENRWTLTNETIMNYFIPVPNYETQKIIATFLDDKTSQIDSLIEKNQRLIELLEEKRTSLINQAVTKGLDPDAPMKDSGIDWIGEIPEHWEIRSINSLSNVKRGASPRPIDDPRYFDDNGEYSWVRISDVTSSEKYLNETREKLSVLGKSLSVPMEPGDIFVSIAATVGKPIITNIKCCIHDGFVYFKNLNINLNKEYLYYIFEGGQAYQGLGKLGTQLNLNTETIGGIHIPYPPYDEQLAISKYISKKIEQNNNLINQIQKENELLEEYKQSLIYNVVTGKVKVEGE